MARYAMVHTIGRWVANVIEWDGNTANWQPPDGYTMVEDVNGQAGPGFTYDEAGDPQFVPPPGGQPGA